MVQIIKEPIKKGYTQFFLMDSKLKSLGILLLIVMVIALIILPYIQIIGNSRVKSNETDKKFTPKIPTLQSTTVISQNFISPNSRDDKSAVRDANAPMFDPKTQYLIITPQAFKDAIEPLAVWKHQKGVYTSIAILDGPDGIESTYTGPNQPAKIHAFLRDYYKNAENLKWLLLVGDSEIIQPRLMLTNNVTGSSIQYLSNQTYSDYYYSALDTNWDTNFNQRYGETGEEDWVPELYVGRLPVNNATETSNVVNKILTYEKNPPAGNWFTKTIQCGALMDRPNILDDLSTYEDEGYNSYKDNAYEVILKVRKFLPENTQNFTFLDYPKIKGGEYSKSDDTLNESNVLNQFNQGASTVNFVSKGDDDGVKHYSGNGISKIEYASMHFFNYNTLRKLENGFQLPLVYSSSCTSANFTEEDDSNLEGLITSTIGGAIGFIGATIDTYRLEFYQNDTSYGNWWLNEEFWRKFFDGEGRFRPGEILYTLKKDYYDRFTEPQNPHPELDYQPLYRTNFFSYNLLGDPEVPVYTEIPTEINVQHPKIIRPIQRNHTLTIKVNDGINNQPVNDANVCIIGKNKYIVARTDNQGLAEINFVIQDEETLYLTVTAHNHYYYESNISIEARQDLLVDSDSIKFDRNPIPTSAEVNISIRVFNNGQNKLTDVKINCYADDIAPENLIIQNLTFDEISIKRTKTESVIWEAMPGSHKIIAIVDYFDEIFEFNESNNIAETLLFENKPPIISNIPDKIIDEDTPAIDALNLFDYTWDDDTKPEELQYFIENISNEKFNIITNNSKLSFYPPDNWFGNVTVLAGVSDGTSSDTDDFTIIVRPVNDPPVLTDTVQWIIQGEKFKVTPGNISISEDFRINVTIIGYDIDDNDKDLLFGAQGTLFSINSTTGNFSFKPDNSMVGVHKINFTLDDGHEENNLAIRSITITVLNTNDPPKLLPVQKYELTVGETFELSVLARDDDKDDLLRYRDNTKFFEINNETGFIKYKPKESDIGTHEIKIIVTDGIETDSAILVLEIKAAPDEPLSANYIIICPSILIIIVAVLFMQEYLKSRKAGKARVSENSDKPRDKSGDKSIEKSSDKHSKQTKMNKTNRQQVNKSGALKEEKDD